MLLHIGYQNYVPREKILAITGVESAPLKRQRQKAEDINKLIDCTLGRKTLSLIHLLDGYIVASATAPDTLQDRLTGIRETKELGRNLK